MSVATDLKSWKDRIAVSARQYETISDKIQIYKQYYRGEQWHQIDSQATYQDHVVDNIVFPNIRAIVPRINFRNPKIFVSPKKKPYKLDGGKMFDTVGSSMILEILLNYYYKLLETKREARRCLYDALLGVWGIMELGYTLKTEKIKSKELLIVDELIKAESIFCKRRSPKDFLVDVEGTDHLLNDRRWVAFRQIESLDDIKASSRFSNTKNLKTNHRVKTDFGMRSLTEKNQIQIDSFNEDPSLWNRVEYWNVWDKKERRLMSIVEGHDKFIRNENKWPGWTDALNGFPAETIYLNENPDEAFPVGDLDIYKRTQDEINMIGSMQLSHLRRISQRRYVIQDGGLVDENEERKLEYGGDGTIVKSNNKPIDQVVPIQDGAISQDIYMVQRLKKMEISSESGVSPMEREQPVKFETATEPALLNQNTQITSNDRRGLFEDFVVRIIKKKAALLQQTLDNELTIPLNANQMSEIGRTINQLPEGEGTREFILSKLEKITSKPGHIILQPWLTLSPEDIKGDYDYDIEVGSTAPVNEETRKRDDLTLSQIMVGNPYIRQREATVEILEDFGKKDIDKLVKSEEEVQQQQQAAAQAEAAPEREDRQIKSQTDLAKTQMKTQSAERIAQGKNRSTVLVSALNKNRRK
jgi:hypothetical protein